MIFKRLFISRSLRRLLYPNVNTFIVPLPLPLAPSLAGGGSEARIPTASQCRRAAAPCSDKRRVFTDQKGNIENKG